MIKLALTNLGQYNEGVLNYTWIELPIEEKDFEKALQKIGIGDEDEWGIPYEEYFFSDWETDIKGVSKLIGEYSNVDTLNEMAEKIESLSEEELLALQAYLETYLNDFNYAYEQVKNGAYIVHNNVQDEVELAYKFVDEYGVFGNLTEDAKRYFNYVAYGRDLKMENTLYFTKLGEDNCCVELLR